MTCHWVPLADRRGTDRGEPPRMALCRLPSGPVRRGERATAVKRLAVLPCLAVACGALWWSDYGWPVMTTAWSIIAPRPATADTEADWPA